MRLCKYKQPIYKRNMYYCPNNRKTFEERAPTGLVVGRPSLRVFFQEAETKGLLGVGPGRKVSTVNYAEAAPPALPSLQPRAIRLAGGRGIAEKCPVFPPAELQG